MYSSIKLNKSNMLIQRKNELTPKIDNPKCSEQIIEFGNNLIKSNCLINSKFMKSLRFIKTNHLISYTLY